MTETESSVSEDDRTRRMPMHTQILILNRHFLRFMFGDDKYEQCGSFVDSIMSRTVYDYSNWIDYPLKQFEYVLSGHTNMVLCCAMSEQGRYLFTGAMGGTVISWDLLQNFVHKETQADSKFVTGIDFYHSSDHGPLLATGGFDTTVTLWDACNLTEIERMHGHRAPVRCVRFYQQGKFILSGSYDMSIHVWITDTGECQRIMAGHTGVIFDVGIIGDGIIMSAGKDDYVRVWACAWAKCVPPEEVPKGVQGLSINCDSTMFCVSSTDCVTVFKWPELDQIRQLEGRTSRTVFHPFVPNVIAVPNLSSIKVYNVYNGQTIAVNKTGCGSIYDLCFTPDGTRLIVTTQGKLVLVWQFAIAFDVSRSTMIE